MAASEDLVPDRLEAAVWAAIRRDSEAARAHLEKIDVAALRGGWDRAITGARSARRSSEVPAEPPGVRVNPSSAQAKSIFDRDRYVCRYCGRRTIDLDVLKALSRAFPDVLPYHPHWKFDASHMLYWTHSASVEHAVPVSRGGTSEPGNLITTCYECNASKGAFLAEELGWRQLPPAEADWDGLISYLPRLSVAADDLAKANARVTTEALASAPPRTEEASAPRPIRVTLAGSPSPFSGTRRGSRPGFVTIRRA
jgi:5-methylcytosine-specific restriction endonuclease McrA